MNPEVNPSYIFRQYIYNALKANDPTVWDEANYGGLVPIVPLNEEPELSEFDGPYAIYINNITPSDQYCYEGAFTMVLADNNFRRLEKTITIIHELLNKEDESASNFNAFSSTINPFIGIRFGWIKTAYSEPPVPPDSEGGRSYAYLVFDYECYVEYDIAKFYPSGITYVFNDDPDTQHQVASSGEWLKNVTIVP